MVLLIVLLKMLAVLGLPFPLHTAIFIATACSSQCVRLGLLLCPTCLAGATGIGAWGVFLGGKDSPMASGPQTLLSPSICLLGGYPWELDCGSVAMVTSLLLRRVFQ